MPELKQHRALCAVKDEKARSALRGYFRSRGDIVDVTSGADLLASARASHPCFILLEMESGDHHLEWLRREFPEIPVIAIVPPAPEMRFEAARCGAVAMLSLPLSDGELTSRLGSVLRSLSCECRTAAGAAPGTAPLLDLPPLFNSNSTPRMMEIRDLIDKVATTSATVLIRGESGVGKEIAARTIFRLSERRDKPFVKVACAAIPNDLLESELFGYEAGAFTGALRAKPGKFDLADGGTVFLDEIAEMHPVLQAKLLHVLQDGEFARLGSKRDTSVDVRVICATNRQLEARVAEGLFREDLLYRINVVTVNIPPLRERRAEIPGLIRYFLDKYSALYQRRPDSLDDQTLDAMIRHQWPGNIRELENFCKRYVIVGDASSMMRELLGRAVDSGPERRTENRRKNADPLPIADSSAECRAEPSLLEIGRQAAWRAERQAIEDMLLATRWNRREAARRLGVSYKALLNKIKQMEQDGVLRSG